MTTRDIGSLHRSTIKELAADLQSPIEVVEQLYHNELRMLETHARIRVYLPLIVRRKVRDALRERQATIKAD